MGDMGDDMGQWRISTGLREMLVSPEGHQKVNKGFEGSKKVEHT